jgi:hypothetical protein
MVKGNVELIVDFSNDVEVDFRHLLSILSAESGTEPELQNFIPKLCSKVEI